MRVYVKIGMLFLAFTCIFALVACKGTDEKKETDPTTENSKMNRIILLKRKSLMKNQIMKDQQNQSQIQARKIQ